MNLFENIQENLRMVKGAYRKLKSYCYYNRDMSYMRKKIAVFESCKDFDNKLNRIAEVLYNNDQTYIQELITQINPRVVPKKYCEENHDVMPTTSNELLDLNLIESVNFFFDGPIEIHILDTLWTCLIAKVAKDKGLLTENMYGNRIKEHNLFNMDGTINFDSSNIFEKYIYNYSEWRDKTFDILKYEYEQKHDTVLYSLDLKGYFYSVNFNEERFNAILGNDIATSEFSYLTHWMLITYMQFTKIIGQYRNDLDDCISKNNTIFPIGLLSTYVLSNLYLYDFDQKILNGVGQIIRYARYVDDILLAIKVNKKTLKASDKYKKELTDKLMKVFFDKGIFEEKEKGIISVKGFDNIKIQREKVSCIHTSSNKKTNLFDVYYELYKYKPSTVEFLPDFELLRKPFSSMCYELNSNDSSYKVKHLAELFPHTKKTTRYVYNFLNCCSGAFVVKDEDHIFDKNISDNLDSMIQYFSSRQGIRFFYLWSILTYILIINGRGKELERFYKEAIKEIKAIKAKKKKNKNQFDIKDIKPRATSTVLKLLKDSMINDLDVMCCSAKALDVIDGKTKELVRQLRYSNLFRHEYVLYPLNNYQDNNNESLILTKESEFDTNKLNDFKLEYSPRFIRFNELNLFNFWANMYCGKIKLNYFELLNRFKVFNHLEYVNIDINESDPIIMENYSIKKIEYKNLGSIPKYDNGFIYNKKIAIASVNLDQEILKEYIFNRSKALSISNKKRTFDLIKEAVKQNADVLVFPEFYLPFEWIGMVSYLCMKHKLTIISGLQYLKIGNVLKNECVVIQPLISKYKQKSVVEIFREKNEYAPDEINQSVKMGLKISNPTNKEYIIVTDGFFSHACFICYEMTDIRVRAMLRGKVQGVFAIEFNPDTNYYCSMVESMSRDLSSFVVQVNTSKYGDSRITAPYKTEEKDIIKIKGGINDTIMVGEIDIGGLLCHNNGTSDEKVGNLNVAKKVEKDIEKLNQRQLKDVGRKIKKLEKREKPLPAGWEK